VEDQESVISEQHISLRMIDSEILEAGSNSGSDVQDPGNKASNILGEHREMTHQLGAKEEACHINKEGEEK